MTLTGVDLEREQFGARVWRVQKQQGTGLCIGLDPHFSPTGPLGAALYRPFVDSEFAEGLRRAVRALKGVAYVDEHLVDVYAGIYGYFRRVIDAARAEGIQCFKPQLAFFERHGWPGSVVLSALTRYIIESTGDHNYVVIGDGKRGDIATTQKAYYDAYFAGGAVCNAITVTTWMGEDVLTPGLEYFKHGAGAVVVTRSSNKSGKALQDLPIRRPTPGEAHPTSPEFYEWLNDVLERTPTAADVMLTETEGFSRQKGLSDSGRLSPILSVMGCTRPLDAAFRRLRPTGIALVPGFGAQGGGFENIEELLMRSGPFAGHWGVLSSSRAHNFPWMEKYGGSGDPNRLESELGRAVATFREAERKAYQAAGCTYPF